METLLAIIGGTGLNKMEGLEVTQRRVVKTPYGLPSGPLIYGKFCGNPVIFLARHGYGGHTIPPHQINYRANIWSLRHVGVKAVIAAAAVGAINPEMQAQELVLPHQLIDYTYGREHTFFEKGLVTHIDFTHPYCASLREKLLEAASQVEVTVHPRGVYAVTQGPRLETAAEIDRLERDGCDLVGMTGMPEAGLARELNLCYATCAIVANPAAGRGQDTITLDAINANLKKGVAHLRQLLSKAIPLVYGKHECV